MANAHKTLQRSCVRAGGLSYRDIMKGVQRQSRAINEPLTREQEAFISCSGQPSKRVLRHLKRKGLTPNQA